MVLWRISNHCDLQGLGGEKCDGRWHTVARGKRIVYLSEHPALALLETLANLKGNPMLFPDSYQLLKVTTRDNVRVGSLRADQLQDNWRDNMNQTRSIGDSWLATGDAALLAVPSIPSPESINYLLNPLHHDAEAVKVEWCRRIEYDNRLFHFAG
jgi:RES domain-containing protein